MSEPEPPPKEGPPETRATRSRSKTPFTLRVSVERDMNGGEAAKPDKVQKSPKVTTIQEELNSPQKSASATGASRSVRKTRTVTSDYSSDGVSPERPTTKEAVSSNAATEKSITVTKTTVTTTVTQSSQSAGSEKSPSKKEVRQNEVNRTLEDSQKAILRTSTPKATSKVSGKITLTPEELQKHVAYKEYREAGEYWNKFPKTDYTYSELSPFRRELASGMIAMPNMSRPGLNKHAERISVMIERNPTQESYIRQRYAAASSKYSSSGVAGGSFAHADPYDSGEETLDLSQLSRASRSYRSKRSTNHTQVVEEHRSFISRFFLSIVNLFYGATHSVSRVFNQSEHNLYYTRIEDERGFFAKTYSFFNMLVTGVFKKVYLLISSVLFLDTWLLQTASSDVQQRKFLLMLLVLLPFLLFGGIYLYLDPTPLQSLRENLSNPLLNYNLKLELPDTEAAKAFAVEKWDSARLFTEHYLDALKLASQNGWQEVCKIWQENVNQLFG
ncbi:hypothetical protein RP20_CCG027081 [Aedes albopictus]|nr:hypothetical protein RP20_CCG027081 [Aedes albopictus]